MGPPVKSYIRRFEVIPPERPSNCIRGGSGANKSEGPVTEIGIAGDRLQAGHAHGPRHRRVPAQGTNSIVDLSAQGRHPTCPSTFGLNHPRRYRGGAGHRLKVYPRLVNTLSARHLYAVGRLAATDLSRAAVTRRRVPANSCSCRRAASRRSRASWSADAPRHPRSDARPTAAAWP